MFLGLFDDEGIEDACDLLLDEVHDVTIGELGREADVVAHDGEDAATEEFGSGLVGEHWFETALGEESVPEGEVLEHVKDTWYANGSRVTRVDSFVGSSEGIVIFFVDLVATRLKALAAGMEDAFALVASEADVAVGEFEADDLTVIGAARALNGVGFNVVESAESGNRVERRVVFLDTLLCNGVESGAVGTHEFGSVGCPDLFAR